MFKWNDEFPFTSGEARSDGIRPAELVSRDAHDTFWGGFMWVPRQHGVIPAFLRVGATMRKDFFELSGGVATGAAGGVTAFGGGWDGGAEALRIESTMSSGVCANTRHANFINPC